MIEIYKEITIENFTRYNEQQEPIARGFKRHDDDNVWVTWCTNEYKHTEEYRNRRNKDES